MQEQERLRTFWKRALSASSDQVTSSSVFLYPNPVKDKLTISGVDNETRLKVVNTAGKVV